MWMCTLRCRALAFETRPCEPVSAHSFVEDWTILFCSDLSNQTNYEFESSNICVVVQKIWCSETRFVNRTDLEPCAVTCWKTSVDSTHYQLVNSAETWQTCNLWSRVLDPEILRGRYLPTIYKSISRSARTLYVALVSESACSLLGGGSRDWIRNRPQGIFLTKTKAKTEIRVLQHFN